MLAGGVISFTANTQSPICFFFFFLASLWEPLSEAKQGSGRGFGVAWVKISHVKTRINGLWLFYIIRHNVACTSFL